ncbi:MAG TPA: thioredoxin family protein [Rummeliibacillus sp.]|nr:thioredoxin family protein [Rummeliibacillus sp.]
MEKHRVLPRDQWIEARKELLRKEKEFTKLRDELTQQRRDLPWEAVNKLYTFDGPSGKLYLADLFSGKSQLIVYHFMFDPSWDQGCKHCSFWADHYSGMIPHLNHRDVSFVCISRAPVEKLEPYKKRMGWTFPWYSSQHTDFNYDFQASFPKEEVANKKAFYNYTFQDPMSQDREGVSVFYKDEDGNIFHTYSTYARGIDMLNNTYQFLDLVPKGRQDDRGLRHHDQYVAKL